MARDEDIRGVEPTLIASDAGQSGVAPGVAASTGTLAGSAVGGRYQILGLVGVGGMGTVYKARDLELDEIVALKVLRRDLIEAKGMLDRFRREVKLARRVTHPNVARTFDIGEDAGEKFLTMEFIEGEPLSEVIGREGALALARVVDIVNPVCAGLAAAHSAGVIHRDLKPENVLISDEGRVVITDFGIARAHLEDASRTHGSISGTPAYMAPEQVEAGGVIDARTDIYALGAMLFELLTGERAWPGESAIAVAAARIVHPPPDPRARRRRPSVSVSALVMRCMARAPAGRPGTVMEVARELSTLLEQETAEPPGVTPTHRSPTSSHGAPLLSPSTALPQPTAGDKTVAVLPFRNAGAPGDEYLADGLTDDLIDTLSMTRGLRVRSRGIVLHHRGAERDPREIGRELDVQVVVEGSVRKVGDSVRITARLSSVADGFQIWAKRFDRPAADVLVVNDEVAHAIAGALTVDLPAPSHAPPEDPIAIDLYLRGRHEYRKFWRDGSEKAVQLFQQALARAPDDPRILAGCAAAAARLWFFGGPGSSEAGALARQMSERAVTLAPDLGEARVALAAVRFQEGNIPATVQEARRALTTAPSNADAHALLGRVLLEVGPLREGIRRCESAIALDPTLVLVNAELARGYALLGDWARSSSLVEHAGGVASEGPAWFARARFTIWRRDKELAARYLAELGDEDSTSAKGVARALLLVLHGGAAPYEAPDFQAMLTAPGGGLRRVSFFRQLVAELACVMGRTEEALEATRLSVDSGLVDRMWMDHCPVLEPIRGDRRFAELRATVEARADLVLAAFL